MSVRTLAVKSYHEAIKVIASSGKNALIVTPSTVWADEINRRLLSATGRDTAAFIAPKALSIGDLIRSNVLPKQPVIDASIQKFLLARAAEDSERKFFKRVSIGVVANLGGAITKLKRNLIDPAELEAILMARGSSKEADLLSVYKKYTELLARNGWLDEDDLWRLFALQAPSPGRDVWLLGFDRVLPVFDQIFNGAAFVKAEAGQRSVPQVFALNSPMDEASLIADKIAGFAEKGLDPNDITLYVAEKNPFAWELAFELARRGMARSECLPYAPQISRTLSSILRDTKWPEKAAASEFIKIAREKLGSLKPKGAKDSPPLAARGLKYIEHAVNSLQALSFWFVNTMGDQQRTRREFLELFYEELSVAPDRPDGLPVRFATWNEAGLFGERLAIMPCMNEGIFPPSAAKIAFFSEPDSLSPSPDERIDAIFERPEVTLRSILRKFDLAIGKDSIITYHIHGEDGADAAPSPFILKYEPVNIPPMNVSPPEAQGNTCGSTLRFENGLNALGEHLKGGHFSATKLEEYANCPFVYFCRYILGVEARDQITPDIQPRDAGTLLHLILEIFFVKYGNTYFSSEKTSLDLRRTVEQVVDEAFGTARNRAGGLLVDKYNKEMVAHFRRRTILAVMNLLEGEREYLKDSTQRPLHFEMDFMETLKDDLTFKGKIDRIDADETSFTLIDYKSGKIESVINNIERGLELQVPIYTEMARRRLKKRPSAAFLYSVKKGRREGKIVCEDLKERAGVRKKTSTVVPAERFDALIEFGLKKAAEYAEKVLAGSFAGEPHKCAAYCDYKDACRYRGPK